jgi:hypothetical protein
VLEILDLTAGHRCDHVVEEGVPVPQESIGTIRDAGAGLGKTANDRRGREVNETPCKGGHGEANNTTGGRKNIPRFAIKSQGRALAFRQGLDVGELDFGW